MTDTENQPLSQNELLELARQGSEVWNVWSKGNPETVVDFSSINFGTRENREINFSNFVFTGEVIFMNSIFKMADFNFCIFSGGGANFTNVKFTNGHAEFGDSKFLAGSTSFAGAIFEGGDADFNGVTFGGEATDFSSAKFIGGDANFSATEFVGGEVYFESSKFSGGDARFDHATFAGGVASFLDAVFGASLDLEYTEFFEIPDFRRTKLNAHFSFHGMKLGNGKTRNFPKGGFEKRQSARVIPPKISGVHG
jgi:uncharacterized protein YjbI with pentapeptide repeats